MSWADYRAALFDLDGVVTATARIHAAAWKETLDGFLAIVDPDLAPMTIGEDYRDHIDGRPRYDGTEAFLASRGITIPYGDPADPPGLETVCGIGNLKNENFNRRIEAEGADVYPDSLVLLDHLTGLGMPLAVVTASANCDTILRSAGLSGMFSVQVDGVVARELGLRGKPAPDPFLEAARLLEVDPAGGVVIEDAVSGVVSARAGGFGLVVAVDRHDSPQKLIDAGADIVVDDLTTLVPE